MKYTTILCCVLFAISVAEDEKSATKLLHKGNIYFTSKFFQDVVKVQKPASSVIISAYCVLTPLAQLSLASEGDTQREILGAMEFPNTDVIKVAFKAANKKVRSAEGVTLKTASRIYIAETLQLNKEFNAVSKDVFDTDVMNVNFKDNVAAADDINKWGKWLQPFDEKHTKNTDFFTTKEKKSNVTMMFQKYRYLYASNSELNAQLLEIPFVKKEASFLIILPNEVDGISSLEEKLKDLNVLTAATKKMFSTEVNLHLPKYKIESTITLKGVLQRIGVKKIFSSVEAQLTKLLQSHAENFYIADGIQKAFIEVNEEGAEAAAATGLFAGASPILPPPPIEFNANHPFLFAIKVEGEIIFSGVLRN